MPGAWFDLIIKENKPIVFVIVEPDVGLIDTIEYGIWIATNVLLMPSSWEEVHIQIELQGVFPENVLLNELFNHILSLRISVERNNTLYLKLIVRAIETREMCELGLNETEFIQADVFITVHANVLGHLVSFDIAIWRKVKFSVLVHFLNTSITLCYVDCCPISECIN